MRCGSPDVTRAISSCALKAAASTSTESSIDFASLPPSALDNYIAYYDLAKGYPPPPSRRLPTPEEDGDEGEVDENGERTSKNIEDGNTVTTATRLRPRSPTSSVAHLLPPGARRAGALVNEAGSGDDGGASTGSGSGPNGSAATAGNGKGAPCPSHFFDAQEADAYLASVAEQHFESQPQPKEGEIVVQFLYRCRTGGTSG